MVVLFRHLFYFRFNLGPRILKYLLVRHETLVEFSKHKMSSLILIEAVA